MPKQICVKCSREFKIERNGVMVIEMFSYPPQPYKIWSADIWKCPTCEREIIAGFGHQAIAEHFQEKFDDILNKVQEGEFYVVFEK